ncbi:Holliday junction resolvase RuvX [Brackiella oedipodis]|uniref:Holliday junction resolvase RuvX n=1 Tax=Brackiella oedipodis TaxID=124225 RepID=UPI00048FA9AA|nr:Holliday junction resolvase RuvX [Brackiella oedipodis]
MLEQTFLAFDFGLKKIGVAIGDSILKEARPLKVLKSETKARRLQLVEQELQTWQPDLVIVGLPLDAEGKEQLTTRQAQRFANQIQGRFDYPVQMVDERYSSLQAQTIQGYKNVDDAAAAAIILQRYLDTLS